MGRRVLRPLEVPADRDLPHGVLRAVPARSRARAAARHSRARLAATRARERADPLPRRSRSASSRPTASRFWFTSLRSPWPRVGWATRRAAPEVRVLLWVAVLTAAARVDRRRTSPAAGSRRRSRRSAPCSRCTCSPKSTASRERSATSVTVDLLLLHLNGLGLFLGVYELLDRQAVAWVPIIGLVLVALHAVLAWWLRPRHAHAALHALAVAFALLAATVGVKFDGAWLTAAWAAEGAAVMWIGLRRERGWFRAAGAVLLAVAAGRWLGALGAAARPRQFPAVRQRAHCARRLADRACATHWPGLHRAHRSADARVRPHDRRPRRRARAWRRSSC